MSEKTEPCYRDYVIVNGEFVGRFEEMYCDVEDPWGCTAEVDGLPNRVLLQLLCGSVSPRRVLDLGCGLGLLSGRIYQACKPVEMCACDVSSTAVLKARRAVPGVTFFVHDLVKEPTLAFEPRSLDLIVMAEVVWYILPVLATVFGEVVRLLAPGGALVVKQTFYPPGEQKYGNDIVSRPDDLVRHLDAAGLLVDYQISIFHDSSHTWICRAISSHDKGHFQGA